MATSTGDSSRVADASRRSERNGAVATLVAIVALACAFAAGTGGGFLPEAIRAEPVDVNGAPESEIALLPGLGPDRARRIVVHREIFGPFRRVDEIEAVKGVGASAVARLRGLAIVRGASRAE